jgi:hypothetical protein
MVRAGSIALFTLCVCLAACSSQEGAAGADAAASSAEAGPRDPADPSASDSGDDAPSSSADGAAGGDAGVPVDSGSPPKPGTVHLDVEIINPSATNAITTPFFAGGTVRFDAPSGSTIFQLGSGATQRSVGIKLTGAVTPGASFPMTGGTYIAYGEPMSKLWSSLLPAPSGSVTIDAMTGSTFRFTIRDVAMDKATASFGNVNGTGSFTIKGTGVGTLP